jgi:hypothetical protein
MGELQQPERREMLAVEVEAFSLETLDASSPEQEEAWVEVEAQSSSEVESPVPDEAEVEVSQRDGQKNEDGDRAAFIAQLTQIAVQYFNTQLRQGEVTEVDSNLAVVESADYWVAYYHNQESSRTGKSTADPEDANGAVNLRSDLYATTTTTRQWTIYCW